MEGLSFVEIIGVAVLGFMAWPKVVWYFDRLTE